MAFLNIDNLKLNGLGNFDLNTEITKGCRDHSYSREYKVALEVKMQIGFEKLYKKVLNCIKFDIWGKDTARILKFG